MQESRKIKAKQAKKLKNIRKVVQGESNEMETDENPGPLTADLNELNEKSTTQSVVDKAERKKANAHKNAYKQNRKYFSTKNGPRSHGK